MEFQGSAFALSSDGLNSAANALNVFAPEIWTVLAVETTGCGFLPDRRPEILYERHLFHRLTGGRFDDGDISDPHPGGYGAAGAHQYDRLGAAIALNRTAALRSASWGIGQVLGDNFAIAGFPDVETMVISMSDSEDKQLTTVAKFLRATKLDVPLRVHDWTSFARGYNGPNFAINHYDALLNGEFQKFSSGRLPDVLVRTAQLYLTYLDFHPGPIDGLSGTRTFSALAQFQSSKQLPVTTTIDANTIEQLQNTLMGVSTESRDNLTAKRPSSRVKMRVLKASK
jgi:hypothetical protein